MNVGYLLRFRRRGSEQFLYPGPHSSFPPAADAHFAHFAKGDFLSAHQWTFSTDQLRATSGFEMMQHAFGQGGARGTRQHGYRKDVEAGHRNHYANTPSKQAFPLGAISPLHETSSVQA